MLGTKTRKIHTFYYIMNLISMEWCRLLNKVSNKANQLLFFFKPNFVCFKKNKKTQFKSKRKSTK